MKAQLRYYVVVLALLPALLNAGAKSPKSLNRPNGKRAVTHALPAVRGHILHHAVAARNVHHLSLANHARETGPGRRTSGKFSASAPGIIRTLSLDSVTELLRLKLYLDPYDYDDIAIAFNSGASANYNPNEDSKYMPGINAAEGLASISNDGVDLSVNFLPLPKQAPDVIRLDIEAQNSGPITLLRTELDSLPKIYQLWLVDNYKKDSINLRTDSVYVFNIDKSDTTTFGTNRFKVVVSVDAAQKAQLLNFNAVKDGSSAQITWTAENEANNTRFAVERSSGSDSTFAVIDSLISNSKGSYSFTDKTPPQGSDQYRLRMTDFSGTISYSNVVTLIYPENNNTLSGNITLYPNPTNGVINITIANNDTDMPATNLALQSIGAVAPVTTTTAYTVRIINVSGIIVKTAASSGASWQDNVSTLTAGTYIISVTNNSTGKMVGKSTFIKL